jgi:FkbM family methyltransferase
MPLHPHDLKSQALAVRQALPEYGNLAISDLLGQPKFFDWVDCRPAQDASFAMYLAGADDGVALRFFWNGHYERTTLRAWSHFARKSQIILDIGAHTGAYTLAALASNGSAQTISFEPYFMNFSRLNMNLRGNGFSPAHAYMVGVGEKSAVMPFSVSSDVSYLSSGGSVGVRENAFTTHIQVVALDDFIPDEMASRINLIKIDVEGFEAACLRGMANLVRKSRPIIFFECTNLAAGREVQQQLSQLGYVFFVSDEVTGQVTRALDVTPATHEKGGLLMNQLNRIALPNEGLIEELRAAVG